VDELRTLAAAEPQRYWVQMALGRALRKNADPDGAMRAFEAAAGLVPLAPGPHGQMAQIAVEKKDRTREIAELQALLAVDFDNLDAARELAAEMRKAGVHDVARIRAVNERIVAIDPFDGEVHTILGRLAMDRNDIEAATRDFKAALALNPIDLAAAHTDLAGSYFRAGRMAEAKKQTLAALEIAPTYPPAQELLLKLVEPRP
jgi:tetratricopeptide (TPR) repeat protein